MEHLMSIWCTVQERRSNSVRCFGGKMMPAAASITFAGSFDSTRTWSNSPVNREGRFDNAFCTLADGFGSELKMKFVEEHQKKHLEGTRFSWVLSVKQ